VVSAALVHRYRNLPVRYWKPVQTGIEQDDDTAEVRRLAGCSSDVTLDEGVRLRLPVSPHLAAKLNGSTIDVGALAAIAESQPERNRWIVEGAGGLMVPLNERSLIIDLIRDLRLPAVVVSRSGLGTINHTLLTIEALDRRAVTVGGVVMVGPENEENRLAIERYGRVAVVGELPVLDPLSPEALRRWADSSLDSGGRLQEWFQ
jgi:dethiobiotin synthase